MPLAIVVAQIVAVVVPGYFAPGTPVQFMGMVWGPMIGLGLLSIWWLFLSRAPWSVKAWIVLVFAMGIIAANLLVHPTIPFMLLVYGLPAATTTFVVAYFLTRGTSWRLRSVVMTAGILGAWGFWTLFRLDGADGTLSAQMSLRWSPTAEQIFLEQLAQEPSPSTEAPEATVPPLALQPGDWPGFRGPQRDSVVTGTVIETDWKKSPPQERWRRPLGPGWSSFALVDGHLFTQEQRGDQEVVTCYDAASGKPIWIHENDYRFTETVSGAGPRATPTFHDGRLFTFGAGGILNALDPATGKEIWSRNVAEDTGAKVPEWGFSSSPEVVNDAVIVYVGGKTGKGIAAYDRTTGEPLWTAEAGEHAYGSPQRTDLGGVDQVLALTDAGVTSVDPVSGTEIWNYDWPSAPYSRVVQPLLVGEQQVLLGTGYGMGSRLINVARSGDEWTASEEWTSRNLKPYFNDTVVYGDALYGFDGNIFTCVDLKTGDRAWKRGRYGNGQVLLLEDQGLLLVLSEKGEVVLLEATPEKHRELAKFKAIDGKTWNHPVVAHGTLYVRNGEEAAAFALPVKTTEVPADPEPAPES
ncbi:PQQ-binding-like beta-propeller repeat protein [Kolteria novifilia]|uniref:PQQ-binding-like beta-propeller repeat protein n=1 Tax=Kolteria novifilia TaxID=2527975 RepID=UPI003AF3992D